jgi:hypothetical protein
MKTITVELVERADSTFYGVYVNGFINTMFSFKEDAEQDSIWSKELNLKKAMKLAKLLEVEEVRTVVYTQTI